jgi:hypothetical protein
MCPLTANSGQAVPNEVEDAVEAQVSTAREAWTRLSQQTKLVSELTILRRAIAEKRQFSQEQAHRVLDLLVQVADQNIYMEIPEFSESLEEFIDLFQAADRDDLVAHLEPLYKDIMLKKIGIVYTMVESLGRMLVAFSVFPDQLGNSRMHSEWDALVARYLEYAAAARYHSYPELPLPYDLILSIMLSEPAAVSDALLMKLQDLNQEERSTVVETLVSLGTGSWRVNGIDAKATLAIDRTMNMLEKMSASDRTYTMQEVLLSVKSEERISDSGAR